MDGHNRDLSAAKAFKKLKAKLYCWDDNIK